MAQLYVSGPVAMHVLLPGQSTPVFLGHGEYAPNIQINPSVVPVKCDVGGEAEFDRIYSGETASVSCDLIRFNNSVLRLIQSRSRSTLFPAAEGGYDLPGQVGTLMVAEGATFGLYLTYMFAFKPAFALGSGGAMRLGYRFPHATLDPETVQPGSARPLKHSIRFACLRDFDPSVSTTVGFGRFILYDENVAAAISAGIN